MTIKKANWKILDKERAKALNISIIESEDRALLSVDVNFVPKGTALEKYINWLIKEKIVSEDIEL